MFVPSLWDIIFSEGEKKSLDGWNSRSFLGDTFKNFRIVNYIHLKTKISLRFIKIRTRTIKLNLLKIRVIYTFSKNLIFFTMNRRFIFSTIWSSITHAILKKKRKTLKKREKITSSWILQIKRLIFQHGDIEVKISHILPFIKRFHI